MSARWNVIRTLLEAKFRDLPGLVATSIAFPGVIFPASGVSQKPSPYYAPYLLPGGSEASYGAGAYTTDSGDYQISIFIKAGAGTNALTTLADALANHFDRVTLSGSGVTVQCGVPVPGPVLTEPDLLHLPVTIPFIAS